MPCYRRWGHRRGQDLTAFRGRGRREENLISIEAIVHAFAFLYGQPPRGWSFEVDVRTSKEKW
jgi:hypothetical protein